MSDVLAVGRSAVNQTHSKLQQLVQKDLGNLTAIAGQLQGYDACFYCLGVSSAGMQESAYSAITYDLTLGAARTLAKLNPGMTFIYVSGAGTDSSATGRIMWARVNLLRLPIKAAYMFRPGAIQPLHGIKSKTPLFGAIYWLALPILSLARKLFPDYVLSTENIGRAMLKAAKHGAPKPVLESPDINRL